MRCVGERGRRPTPFVILSWICSLSCSFSRSIPNNSTCLEISVWGLIYAPIFFLVTEGSVVVAAMSQSRCYTPLAVDHSGFDTSRKESLNMSKPH